MPSFEQQCRARDTAPQASTLNAAEIYIVNGRVMNPAAMAGSDCPCARGNPSSSFYDQTIGPGAMRQNYQPVLYRPGFDGYQNTPSFYGQDQRGAQNFYSFPATINIFRTENGWTLQINMSQSAMDGMQWNPGRQLSDSLPVGRPPQFRGQDQSRPRYVDGGNGLVFDTQTQQWYRSDQRQRLPNSREQQYYDPQTGQWYRIPPPQVSAQQRQYEQWLQQQRLRAQFEQEYQQRTQGNPDTQPPRRLAPYTPAPVGRARYGVDPRTGAILDRRNQEMRDRIDGLDSDIMSNMDRRVQGGRTWKDPLDFDPTGKKVGESVGNYLRRYGPDQRPRTTPDGKPLPPPSSTFDSVLGSFGDWVRGR